MIIGDFLKALGQIGDPRFRRVLFIGIALTVALLVAAYAAFLWILNWALGDEVILPLVGEVTWVTDLLSATSLLVMILLSAFLMVPVASAITSMFLEDVAQAVEDRHYPRLPPASSVPFLDAMRDTLSFLGVLIAANTVAIVLYIMFPPAAVFIFWALNGFFLGREYFQLAAMRRVGRAGAKRLRSRNAAQVWLAGILMAIPLSIPLVSLLVPILGAATFTHLFHRVSEPTSG